MNKGTPRSVDKVYFFQRSDGTVLVIDGDREAWNMYAHPTKVFTNDVPPRLIGTSRGQHYFNATRIAPEYAKEHGLPAAQEMVRKAYLEEIEIAKQTIIPPPNYDTVDKYGKNTKI